MNFSKFLPIVLVQSKDCFVRIPSHLARLVNPNFGNSALRGAIFLKLSWQTSGTEGVSSKSSFVSWNGGISGDSESLEMPLALAKTMEIDIELDTNRYFSVLIEVVDYIKNAFKVQVEPVSCDDFEVIEFNAEYIENEMLTQVCVVYPGQLIPLWVHSHTLISLKVFSCNDEIENGLVPYKLTSSSELIVKPMPRKSKGKSEEKFYFKKSKPLRVTPLSNSISCHVLQDSFRQRVILHPETLSEIDGFESLKEDGQAVVCLLDCYKCSTYSVCATASEFLIENLDEEKCLRSMSSAVVIVSGDDAVAPSCASVSKNTMMQLGISYTSLITLKLIRPNMYGLSQNFKFSLQLINSRVFKSIEHDDHADELPSTKRVLELFKSKIKKYEIQLQRKIDEDHIEKSDECVFVLSDGMILSIPYNKSDDNKETENNHFNFVINISNNPSDAASASKHDSGIPRHIIVSDISDLREIANKSVVGDVIEHHANMKDSMILLSDYYSGLCMDDLGGLESSFSSGSGTGKTSILSASARAMRLTPSINAKTVYVPCRKITGHSMKAVLSFFSEVFKILNAHVPSVLTLDDLDILCPLENEELGPANQQSARIAEHLSILIASRAIGVAVIATSRNEGAVSIHSTLWCSGFFDQSVPLTPPNAKQRTEILKKLCQDYSNDMDWEEIAIRTESFRPSDLSRISLRAKHAAMLRSLKKYPLSKRIVHEDIMESIEGFIPEALSNANLSKSNNCRWKDIGGLQSTRSALEDILALPVKYRQLVEKAPCRLPTGALLYGPSGCGKTLLAGAAAKQCRLNFISVKGPEILDKYIGASEQAVRDLFIRAAAAAPCLLFFDEFDAVAPRRGSDNTGVTDRVVNQLLTFLDGVESVKSVYVLAATSRPDMIDPALLRPGRLDQLLYCGFPSPLERIEIFRLLSKNLPMAEGVPKAFEQFVSSEVEGTFTGADIQGLVNTAQLEAIHEFLKYNSGNIQSEVSEPQVIVEMHHAERAFAQTRPSVSSSDKVFLENLYRKFEGARETNFSPASAADDGNQRTALK